MLIKVKFLVSIFFEIRGGNDEQEFAQDYC